MLSNIEFRFSKPSDAATVEPSTAMKNALQDLSKSEEVRRLAADAQRRGRKVVLHVFHSATGYPILIHVGAVPKDAA